MITSSPPASGMLAGFDLPRLRRHCATDGFFLLSAVIPPEHLELLRRVSTQAIAEPFLVEGRRVR